MSSLKHMFLNSFIKKGLGFGGAFIGATHFMVETPYTSKQALLIALSCGLAATIFTIIRGEVSKSERSPATQPKTILVHIWQYGIMIGLFLMGGNHLLDGKVYTLGHAAIILLIFSASALASAKWHSRRLPQ